MEKIFKIAVENDKNVLRLAKISLKKQVNMRNTVFEVRLALPYFFWYEL